MPPLTDRAAPELPAEPAGPRGRSRWSVVLAGLFGLLVGVGLGVLITLRFAPGPSLQPYLDGEFDYLGAVATWPAEAGAERSDPFGGDVSDAELILAGRTVCTRAADPGMSFDGMADLLGFDPHQTYVVMAEAADKLCSSQSDVIEAHFD